MLVNIIGYGNQAKVWAFNLRDSGFVVNILLREKSLHKIEAEADQFPVFSISNGLQKFTNTESVFCLLIPDDQHESFFKDYKDLVSEKHIFVFAHAWSLVHGLDSYIKNYALLAPKAIATALRNNFINKKDLVAVLYLENMELDIIMHKLADGLGITKLIYATPEQELNSDLLTEQSLLCGGVPKLIKETVDALVNQGIPRELAVFESVYELKYIMDTILELGSFRKFYDKISPLALFGAYKYIKEGDSVEKALNDIEGTEFINYIKKLDINNVKKYMQTYFQGIDNVLGNKGD